MAEDTEHKYTALRLEQQPGAPLMYVLGVDAAGLLEWADVPNAKADYMAGYQRVYSKERAEEIRDFLAADPNNIIPGSVIVTVAGEAIVVEDQGGDVVRITVKAQDSTFEDRLSALYDWPAALKAIQENLPIFFPQGVSEYAYSGMTTMLSRPAAGGSTEEGCWLGARRVGTLRG